MIPVQSAIQRRTIATATAAAIYITSIILSNYLITHYSPAPVAPTLAAPAGVWAAALSFPARDVTQRLGGRTIGILCIIAGATTAYLITQNPIIATASGTTYLLSESADFAVYTPLSRRHFTLAVILSSTLAVIIDSTVFLHLAHLPSDWKSVLALTLGKLYVIAATAPIIIYLRRKLPSSTPPERSITTNA